MAMIGTTTTESTPRRDILLTTSTIDNNQPGEIRVIRRNGAVVIYDKSKIAIAITKAFNAVVGKQAPASTSIHIKVETLVNHIDTAFQRRMPSGGTLHIEDIQDQVELALMRIEEAAVARTYVLYREERRRARENNLPPQKTQPALHVTLDDGAKVPLDLDWLQTIVADACQGIPDVEPRLVVEDIQNNLFDGIKRQDIYSALILSGRTFLEREPNYTYVTARLLLQQLRNEALGFLELAINVDRQQMQTLYPTYFQQYIERGIKLKRIDSTLASFDLTKLGNALLPDRDYQFTYLGLQTLYDRYFIHTNDIRFELPQAFFMRVAMGLALNETDKEDKAIEFYQLLSSFDYMSSTPTLFNSGTLRPQLSSCYLSTFPDDLSGIYSGIKDNALLSKYAGGLGNDWTPVRALGAHIQGTNGKSQGVVPFMVVANATMVAVNQGGKRKGAGCAYLETFHKDIKEFLDLRKNTGDERRRTHDMNTANWIPDLFMIRVHEDGEFTLFSPDEAPELHELYGNEFEKAYLAYEEKARNNRMKNVEVVSAKALWRKMLSLLFETGHPWITFKDPCNIRSPQQHQGIVHSSNLCTEITLNTSADEIAVCNLGSINLPAHINNNILDKAKLKQTITTAIRMLDNVIDINYYSVPQARNSNLKHRPIGLGLMGFQDALFKMEMNYGSADAVEFADSTMELISYYAIEASCQLAEERGSYSTFAGSLWSQGILPIDSIALLEKARGKQYLDMDRSQQLDWNNLRKRVQTIGMRNSNVMAIAPTATISNIIGVTQSIEPTI